MLNNLFKKLREALHLQKIDTGITTQNQLLIEGYLNKHLYDNPKYLTNEYLNKYEFQAFSQFGEDGIIREIFDRIGVTNRYFVEFGVEDGTETNTTYLLYQNWNGLWIDGSEKNKLKIEGSFAKSIQERKLKIVHQFITAENIETIFKENNVPVEFDLLSIDIDRNDHHVWNAICNFNPRLVIIEYNAIFRPPTEFIVNYNSSLIWDKTSNFGASLESYCKLAEEKGYKLVATCFAGVNAFFLKKELAEKYFQGPFTADHFFEPPKYFLYTKNGHPRKIEL